MSPSTQRPVSRTQLTTAINALTHFQPGYSGKCFDRAGNPCPVAAYSGALSDQYTAFFRWVWTLAGSPSLTPRPTFLWASPIRPNDSLAPGFAWFQETLHDDPRIIRAILLEEAARWDAESAHALSEKIKAIRVEALETVAA